jgi:hypothetical protein
MSTNVVIYFAVLFVALGPGLWVVILYRLSRLGATIRRDLSAEGYAVRSVELRWLTRGPFRDTAVPLLARRRVGYLFRVFAENPAGRPCSGWARWRPRYLLQPSERSLVWDAETTTVTPGISSPLFFAIILLASSIALTIVLNVFLRGV